MRYRRSATAGGTYFFTVNLANRNSTLLTDHIDFLRNAVKKIRSLHPFHIVAMVVLPDHLHAIWQLPGDDAEFSLRWSLIKAEFSKLIPKTEYISQSRKSKRERGIWQRRFWEHQIRDDTDLQNHVYYIYTNPVKHGYVKKASDWPYSTMHRDILMGIVDKDWGVENGE